MEDCIHETFQSLKTSNSNEKGFETTILQCDEVLEHLNVTNG